MRRPSFLTLALSIVSEARRSAVPVASVTMPATASPLLHQLAFRPDAVEHLQQQGAQQLLRRDRGTAFAGVELRKATVELAQHVAHKRADRPQWMVRRYPCLRRYV